MARWPIAVRRLIAVFMFVIAVTRINLFQTFGRGTGTNALRVSPVTAAVSGTYHLLRSKGHREKSKPQRMLRDVGRALASPALVLEDFGVFPDPAAVKAAAKAAREAKAAKKRGRRGKSKKQKKDAKPPRRPKQTKVWKRAGQWYQELKDDRALRRVAGLKNPNLVTVVAGAWIALLSAVVAPFALGAVSVHAFGLVVMYIGMSSVPNNGTTPACNYVMMAMALFFVLEWFFESDGKALTAEEQKAAEEQELIDQYGSLAAAEKALAKQRRKDEEGEDTSFGGNVRKQRKAAKAAKRAAREAAEEEARMRGDDDSDDDEDGSPGGKKKKKAKNAGVRRRVAARSTKKARHDDRKFDPAKWVPEAFHEGGCC